MNVRTLRSFPPALALAALLGLAGASSSADGPSGPGGWQVGVAHAPPAVAAVVGTPPGTVPGILPDGGPSFAGSARAARGPRPDPFRLPARPRRVSAAERLAPALGRDGHPSTAPPRSR